MTSLISISDAEELAAADVLRQINREAKHAVPLTVRSIFRRWQLFVTDVERGYRLSIYDYANDLEYRDLITVILRNVSPPFSEMLAEKVAPWDERFLFATRKIERGVAPNVTPGDSLWWFRIPNVLSDELRADLQGEGFLV